MYCPPDVNTGFIELIGPIQQPDLANITIKSYPLSISFAPRTTPPTLIGNRIDESTENTCTYKGNKFSLVDVQICSVTNKGYLLPGQTKLPVAELILSFSANNSAADQSGILLCVPIYDSGNAEYAEYINQLITPSFPSCKYTTELNASYSGQPYQTLNNQTLSNCISSACSDQKILAYTYTNGKCMLYESVPLKNSTNGSISGTVDHNIANDTKGALATCDTTPKKPKKGEEAKVPTLESIFYSWDGDTSQTSLAYKTCFEVFDKQENVSTKSLYIVVFPNGIHLTHAAFQQLMLQFNGQLSSYMIPPAIRGGEATLKSYTFDDDGNKEPTIISKDGIIYSTPISSCTDDFKNRFEYFTFPPRLPVSKLGSNDPSGKCPYYKTTQYKCVPFNQLKDLSGTYVIPGNKTLDTVLNEQEQAKIKAGLGDISSSESLTTEQIEGIVAGVVGGGLVLVLLIWAGSKISKYA